MQRAAIWALGELHANELAPELKEFLKEKDSYMLETTITVIGTLRDSESVPEIRTFIKSNDPYVQASAINALSVLKDYKSIYDIRRLMNDRNSLVQAAAIKAVVMFHDEGAIIDIRKLIQSRDLYVQQAAINAVAALHDVETITEVRKYLERSDFFMQWVAIEAIETLHDTESIPKLRNLLKNRYAQIKASKALATFRDEESIPAIRTHLHWNDSWMKPVEIKALATLHDSESISEIRKFILASDPSVQAAAVEALGALHDKEALAEIRRFLDSGEPDVQMAAVKVLGMLHDSRAVPAIRSLIGKGDWKVQEAAIRALGELHDIASISAISKGLSDRYPDIQLAAAQALARLNHSSPQLLAWQQKKLDTAQEKSASTYPDERTEAAINLASIFTQQSVELLGKLMDDAEQSVVMPAVDSLGIIGEYAPGLVQQQIPKLLALTNHDHLDMQEAAVNALGRIVSFRGKEKAADFPETDQKIRSTFCAFILDQEPKNSFRRIVAIDALGVTGRQECAQDFARLLKKDDPHYYRCLYWMKRLETDDLTGDALKEKLQKELDELTAKKELWRQQRDQKHELPTTDAAFTSNAAQDKDAWQMEAMEHLLGNALARIDSEKTGIKLLYHPLDQVRQGAIRALAAKADAALIGKIIQAHQNFDPADLPSPFPYAAFQAIDLVLWNLEYTGTKDDLNTLKNIKLEPCKIPGQEGAIEERLEWTIARLKSNLKTYAERKQQTAASP